MTLVGRMSFRLVANSRRFLSSCRHDGPARAHFDGRKFRNQVPTKNWSGHVMKWLMRRDARPWPEWVDTPSVQAVVPASSVGPNELRCTFVNHSTVLIQTCGLNLLTDPVWSHRVGPFPWLGAARVRDPGVRFENLPKIDAILLSHDHYDHLDVPTVRRLVARDQPRLFCGLGVERSLEIDGLSGAEPLDWWQGASLGNDIKVTFTPSRHFSGRGLNDQDSTLWGSFVVHTPVGPLYFAGDTGYGPHFREVRERFGPMACALLPIGCYEPRWFMEPFHMSPIEAVQAHVDLSSSLSIGIHLGTFRLGDESYEQPAIDLAQELTRLGLPPNSFVAPEFGEAIAMPREQAVKARKI